MHFQQLGSIIYFQFHSFENQGLYHAAFTRHGGCSPSPWSSLNFGASVGDDIDRVLKNRQNAFDCLGVDIDSVFDVYQVHSTEVIQAERSLPPGEPHFKADAIITNVPGVTLLMRFADCVPILLFDPTHRAVGIVHAGWKGTINRIAAKTVARMQESYGTNPNDLLAAIGPSIGPDHYSIKPDVSDLVITNFGKLANEMIIEDHGSTQFDLWKTNEIILNQAGVFKVEIAGLCTACHVTDWYSHRGERGITGRFGVVLGLTN